MAIYEELPEEQEGHQEEYVWLRYIIHGFSIFFIYAILQVAMILASWPFIASALIWAIPIVLLISLGPINAKISKTLWDIEANDSLGSYLTHSIALIVFLFIIDLPAKALMGFFIWGSIGYYLISAIMLLIYIPITGFVSKLAAEAFEATTPDNIPLSMLKEAQ